MKNSLINKWLVVFSMVIVTTNTYSQQNTFPSSGNIGIGTTSPLLNLDIRHNAVGGIMLQRSNMTPTIGKGLYLTGGGYSSDADWGGISAGVYHDLGTYSARSDAASGIEFKNGSIYFRTAGNLTDGAFNIDYPVRLEINPNGQIISNAHMNFQTNQLKFSGASSGENYIQGFGGSEIYGTWLFKSMHDNMIFDAGINESNPRNIIYKVGGTEYMRVSTVGNLGIGTDNPEYKLDVAGTIRACEIKVNLRGGWCDYVFDEGYNLMALTKVEEHIKTKGHLHNTPSAEQIESEGLLDIEATTVNQQEKIEEIFLHLISLQKQIEDLQAENLELKRNRK